MEQATEQIKTAIHQILGDVASEILMARLDKAVEEGSGDKEALAAACGKIEKLVNLFIGTEEARVIGKGCKEILEKN
jgi:hypothetical protein